MRRCRRPSGPADSQVPSGGHGARYLKISCLYASMCAAPRVSGGIRACGTDGRAWRASWASAARRERGRSMSDAFVDRAIYARREWARAFGRRRQVRAVPRLLADRGLPGRSLGGQCRIEDLRMATGACQRQHARRGQGKGGRKAVVRGSQGPVDMDSGQAVCAPESPGLGTGACGTGNELSAPRAASPHSIQGWDEEQCAAGGPIRPEMQGRKPSLCALRLRPLTDRPPSF